VICIASIFSSIQEHINDTLDKLRSEGLKLNADVDNTEII